ncbi:caspase 7 [Mytilus galloprovincialis]|uniref:Caspase 7 n=1 Tax=Mytilus galloprovincialis TaxID=29158 RepID=A0A8B6EQN3_MYTGA|nr:caspase 7 [Mytilus galloprovincialis]
MPVPKEALDKHAYLTTQLSNYIDSSIDKDQYEQLLNRLKSVLTPKDRNNAKTIMHILESMEKKSFIAPGKYADLKKILSEFDERIARDVIEPIEEEINDILAKNSKSTKIQPELRGGGDIAVASSYTDEQPPNKKRKTSQIAIPDSAKYVYANSGQKGLMLILNFSRDREGSTDDVEKLKSFFEDKFKFEIETLSDLKKEVLQKELTEFRDEYLNSSRHAKKYYCFVCVIMSHGNEKGIMTDDRQPITMDEITSYFKNKETPHFIGKPKIFLVQACRGSATQPVVTPDDWPEDTMSVPHDADILIAYATTPGYKCFRTKYSDIGAWFIHVLLEEIEESYESDHLEDMLISVRHRLAIDEEWRRSDFCQMPCTWTTLTKRLFFR